VNLFSETGASKTQEGKGKWNQPKNSPKCVVNMKRYIANGYGPFWRVSGNIIGIKPEVPNPEESLPTVAEALAA
jgi:hypothetical protein